MKRVFIGAIVIYITFFGFINNIVFALTPELLIVEIQTGSLVSASEELVRIANTTDKNIDLTDIRLEYFSASTNTINLPNRTIKLAGNIPPKQTYLIASKGYMPLEANLEFNPTLAGAGGHLRLSSGVITNPNIYDFVGWGTAKFARGGASVAPPAGQSLYRHKDSSGNYLFSGNNNVDLGLLTQDSSLGGVQTTTQFDYTKLKLTELLPNPAGPKNDADDEYIEIYNSGNDSIDLDGLILKTGNNLNYTYKLKSNVLSPKQYLALYSKDTNLSLANTGGKSELQSPRGDLISKTGDYETAPDGLSYSFDGEVWRWTKVQTPNSENMFEDATVPEKQITKKALTKKPKSVKKSSKKGQVKSATTRTPNNTDTQQVRPVKYSVIAGVGTLGLIYGLYEYRHDFTNLIHKIRKRRSD